MFHHVATGNGSENNQNSDDWDHKARTLRAQHLYRLKGPGALRRNRLASRRIGNRVGNRPHPPPQVTNRSAICPTPNPFLIISLRLLYATVPML
jgi:hypothetical protein